MTQAASGANGAVEEIKQEMVQNTEGVIEQQEAPAESPVGNDNAQEPESGDSEQSVDQSSRRPRRGGFQKKIERLAAENAALRAQLAGNAGNQNAQPQESVNAPQGRPRPEDFQDKTYEEYVEALADWKVEQRLQQREQKQKQETLQESYNRQMNEAREAYPDFEEALADYEFELMPMHAREAILHSDMGAHIAYHIANNPEVGDALSRLSPVQAAIRIGELAAKLKSESSRAKPAAKITKAPPPISPLKGSAPSQRSLQDYIDAGDHEGYAAARRAGLSV